MTQQEAIAWLAENWYSIIATLAAVIGIPLAYWRGRSASKQVQIEERRDKRQRERESQANLRAQFYKGGRSYRLRVYNEGPAPATNIQFRADGKPPSERAAFMSSTPSTISRLDIGAHRDFVFAASKDTPLPVHIELVWDDESGGGEWASELSPYQ